MEMQPDEIKNQLKAFFKREFQNVDIELTESTHLLDEWFVDSFGIVNTTLFIEEYFDIAMSRADINASNFRSIETLAQFVAGQLKKTDAK
jgi:acyl carrier protein